MGSAVERAVERAVGSAVGSAMERHPTPPNSQFLTFLFSFARPTTTASRSRVTRRSMSLLPRREEVAEEVVDHGVALGA